MLTEKATFQTRNTDTAREKRRAKKRKRFRSSSESPPRFCRVTTWSRNLRSHLSEAESVGHDAVHGVGIHLGPLELEVVDSGFVLPHGVVGVVVELWGVRLAWSRRREENYSCMSTYHRQSED